MQDNDFNIIKPVETLQNVGALSPLDRHPEKRQKQSRRDKHSTQPDEKEALDETAGIDTTTGPLGSIDYRA
jgi:hypothetical protein